MKASIHPNRGVMEVKSFEPFFQGISFLLNGIYSISAFLGTINIILFWEEHNEEYTCNNKGSYLSEQNNRRFGEIGFFF